MLTAMKTFEGVLLLKPQKVGPWEPCGHTSLSSFSENAFRAAPLTFGFLKKMERVRQVVRCKILGQEVAELRFELGAL